MRAFLKKLGSILLNALATYSDPCAGSVELSPGSYEFHTALYPWGM